LTFPTSTDWYFFHLHLVEIYLFFPETEINRTYPIGSMGLVYFADMNGSFFMVNNGGKYASPIEYLGYPLGNDTLKKLIFTNAFSLGDMFVPRRVPIASMGLVY